MDAKIIVLITAVLLTGCAGYSGPNFTKDILNCTERLSDRTGAHIVDSSNVCIKAYKFEQKVATEL